MPAARAGRVVPATGVTDALWGGSPPVPAAGRVVEARATLRLALWRGRASEGYDGVDSASTPIRRRLSDPRPPSTATSSWTVTAGRPDVLARACISWNDLPDGSNWTLHQHRIWNPPGGVDHILDVYMFTNTGAPNGGAALASGSTLLKRPESVGGYTAKFAVSVRGYSSVPWCIYMIPRGYNIAHNNC